MRNVYLIIMFTILNIFIVCGQGADTSITQKDASVLLHRLESEMQKHYSDLDKRREFEDPLSRIAYLFKTAQRVSPGLLSDNMSYKDSLLGLMTDPPTQKNDYIVIDISYLLYNLQIDDYIDLLKKVLKLYEQNIISYDVFASFIFQDPNVSNSVAKNYSNKKLQTFFSCLLHDEILMTKIDGQSKIFRQDIDDLKTGKSWYGTHGLRKLSEIQPPILETLKRQD